MLRDIVKHRLGSDLITSHSQTTVLASEICSRLFSPPLQRKTPCPTGRSLFYMWDVLSLLWRAQSSPAPGAHKRPLWAVMLDRKKRIKEESGHRGSTKTQQRNQEEQTERPLS